MDTKGFTNANRAAWNQAASVHEKTTFEGLLNGFKQPGFSTHDETFFRLLNNIGVNNLAVAQPACNNGREILSVKNLGAGRCVGFDISSQFLNQARLLRDASGLECEFVETDLYEIPSSFDANFDLVFTTIGVLGWMPDLDHFFSVLRRLLKINGWLLIYEMHPILDMFEPNDNRVPPQLENSYFKVDPWVETNGLDYYSGSSYNSSPSYYFHHTLSQIFGSSLKAGFTVKSFNEYPHDISNEYSRLENIATALPMSFSLTAQAA